MDMGMDVMKQEIMFNKYDKDGSGAINYDEFRAIWVKVRERRITEDKTSSASCAYSKHWRCCVFLIVKHSLTSSFFQLDVFIAPF